MQKVIAAAPTSMLIVPADERLACTSLTVHLRRMLLPLDCSQRAECILPAATELAGAMTRSWCWRTWFGARDAAPHGAVREDLALPQLVERNRRAAQRYLRDVQSRLAGVSDRVQVRLCVAPRPAQTLHELAQREGIDLVILSAHGSTGDAHQRRSGALAAEFLQAGYGRSSSSRLRRLGDERPADAPRAERLGA